MSSITVGVIGNPNSGKTTLFNALTGARQRVGNWPGVTVDRKTGRYGDQNCVVEVVDLPGVYTLGGLPGVESLDEKVAQDYVLSGEADVFVNVLDASNLERNLYLTAQILELSVPLVVVLNMADRMEKDGKLLDAAQLSCQLGCQVITASAHKNVGIEAVKKAIVTAATQAKAPTGRVEYGAEVEDAIAQMQTALSETAQRENVAPRWLAVKLLEEDETAQTLAGDAGVSMARDHLIRVEENAGDDADTLIADGRYTFAHTLAHVCTGGGALSASRKISDALDRFVLSGWLGIPIFLALMYLMFTFTINIGGAFIDFFRHRGGDHFCRWRRRDLASHWRTGVGQGFVGRWRRWWGSGGGNVHSHHWLFVSVFVGVGRFRLHGARSLFDGSFDARHRPSGQGVRAVDRRVWL